MQDKKIHKICTIVGDGIGIEIIPEAVRVLQNLPLDFAFIPAEAGYGAYQKYNTPLPDKTVEECKNADAILLGAVTTPPNIKNYFSPVLKLRQELNLFANIRPCVSLPLPNLQEDIDIIIVRENTEGLYSGSEKKINGGAITERIITKAASERIVRFAFELARKENRKKITLVHKANVLRLTCGIFLAVSQEIAQEYPEIDFEDAIVDSCAYRIARRPQDFDVLVASNMFGDILSDLTAAFVGGLGVVPSANIGKNIGMFEPVHGSGPRVVGQKRANPIATLLSVVMMLNFLGEDKSGRILKRAIFRTIRSGRLTPDLNGDSTTQEVADDIIKNLK